MYLEYIIHIQVIIKDAKVAVIIVIHTRIHFYT